MGCQFSVRASVRARLFFALAALAFATFLVGAIAWTALERTTKRVERLHSDTLEAVDRALTLSRQAADVATKAPFILLLDSPFRISQEGDATRGMVEDIRRAHGPNPSLDPVLTDLDEAVTSLVHHMQKRAIFRDRTLRINAELAGMERRVARLVAGTGAPLHERQDWFALERLAAALIGAGRAENLIGVGEFQREYHRLRLAATTDNLASGRADLDRMRTLAEGPDGLFDARRLELTHQIAARAALDAVRRNAATLIAEAEATTAQAQGVIAAEREETTSAIGLQKTLILIIALFAAALALTAALFVSGYVTGNLKAVSDAMMRLAAGDRSSRLPRGEGAGDEIGKLFFAFRTFRANTLRLDRSNRRLAQRTALFDNMMRGISDGVAILSDAETILMHNDRFAEMLNLGPHHPVARASLEVLIGQAGWVIEETPTGRDGMVGPDGRYFTRRSSPLPNGGQVVLLTDVTEQHQLEGRMEQIRRIEALGKVTGEVAHDFGNVLSTINASLHLLDNASPDRLRELLGSITNAAEIGTALVQRLLAFARRQRLSPETIELGTLVEGVADLVALALRDEITFEIDPGAYSVIVRVDPGQLESALLNLCLNAAHAIEGPGRITLAVSATPQIARIDVTDTGQGMSDEVLKHAMEPFFSARSDGSGTGLGLAMVYGFIRQSGGEMLIRSQLGTGTTVTMTLPREPLQPEPDVTSKDVWRRVLIIDDDPEDLDAHCRALAPLAGGLVTAPDLETGLAHLEDGQFDLVVTDLSLSGQPNGWRIAEVALAMGSAVAVVSGRLPECHPFSDRPGKKLVTLAKPLDPRTLVAAFSGPDAP
ncbi:ATP-binding protein [Thioclava sp. A2]|nr:ATP-binding protein [Thioclava sp. A2]